MTLAQIAALPVGGLALPQSHLYFWAPNALLAEALTAMTAWGVRTRRITSEDREQRGLELLQVRSNL